MKHIKKATLIALTLCALPVLATPNEEKVKEAEEKMQEAREGFRKANEHYSSAIKAMDKIKTVNKFIFGTLTVCSLCAVFRLLPDTYKLGKTLIKAKEIPSISHSLVLTAETLSVCGGLCSIYIFGKKFGQQFGWFNDKPVEDQPKTDLN